MGGHETGTRLVCAGHETGTQLVSGVRSVLMLRQRGGPGWRVTAARPSTDAEMLAMRTSVGCGPSWRDQNWQKRPASRLSLESALRSKRRPQAEDKK